MVKYMKRQWTKREHYLRKYKKRVARWLSNQDRLRTHYINFKKMIENQKNIIFYFLNIFMCDLNKNWLMSKKIYFQTILLINLLIFSETYTLIDILLTRVYLKAGVFMISWNLSLTNLNSAYKWCFSFHIDAFVNYISFWYDHFQVISWFNFWLDVEAVPGRVSLSITTLLTLATQSGAARMALPQEIIFAH